LVLFLYLVQPDLPVVCAINMDSDMFGCMTFSQSGFTTAGKYIYHYYVDKGAKSFKVLSIHNLLVK